MRGGCPFGLNCTEQEDGSGRCDPVGQCPPPTCDCPAVIAPVLRSSDAGADLERRFRCMTQVGTKGDTFEAGLEAMERALSPAMTADGAPNAGFLRDDAYLGVVFLSDENDCSGGLAACDLELGDADAFCADRVQDSGRSEPTCVGRGGQAFNGRRYIQLAESFGRQGLSEPICGDPETGTLDPAMTRLFNALSIQLGAHALHP